MLRHSSFFRTVALSVSLLALSCHRETSSVTLYTSQDREYAEPILQDFTRQTGIKVKTLYDSEAAKTVGLASRLLAEKSHPQCDVFWNNEELRTWQLAAKGVLQTNWNSMGYRTRALAINRVFNGPIPTLQDLTNRAWHGKVALAYPLFGTTATHFLGLRQYWGPAVWENWCRALQANKPFVVGGNSDVVKLVAHGEAIVGMTDSDDIAAAQREGLQVMGVALNPPMLIPNTIALVTDRPHPQPAERLIAFLRDPNTANRLVEAHALENADSPDNIPGRLEVNYSALLHDLDSATRTLEGIFLK